MSFSKAIDFSLRWEGGYVNDEDDLMFITARGKAIRLHCKDIRAISRNTQGVRLLRLEEGDKVSRVAPVVAESKEA